MSSAIYCTCCSFELDHMAHVCRTWTKSVNGHVFYRWVYRSPRHVFSCSVVHILYNVTL